MPATKLENIANLIMRLAFALLSFTFAEVLFHTFWISLIVALVFSFIALIFGFLLFIIPIPLFLISIIKAIICMQFDYAVILLIISFILVVFSYWFSRFAAKKAMGIK